MRVPVDWLREYVAVPATARGLDIAADLVRVGLEEEGLHGGEITGPLVVGRVISQVPEPQKKSATRSPGLLLALMMRSIRASGFWVG